MKFEVTILGCSSATPVEGRNPTSQLIQINGRCYLIDCGEGTQQQLVKYELGYQKIEYIFISHLHGDHYFGLMGLMSTMHLHGRKKELTVFAPAALKPIIDLQLEASQTVLNYPLKFVATQANYPEIIFENTEIKVETLILNHRIPCTGFKFTQIFPKRKLLKEKIEGIPAPFLAQLKNAENITLPDGTVIYYEQVSVAGKPHKIYAYCSDTMPDESYLSDIKGVDVLYHEATFMHDLLDRAQTTHHTTSLQAAEIAKNAEVKNLVLGHYSSRYKDVNPLLKEAKSVFPASVLAFDGFSFQV